MKITEVIADLHRRATIEALGNDKRFESGDVAEIMNRMLLSEQPADKLFATLSHLMRDVEKARMKRPKVSTLRQRIEIRDAEATVIPLGEGTRVRAIDATADDFMMWVDMREGVVRAQIAALGVLQQHVNSFVELSRTTPEMTVLDEIKRTHNAGWIVVTDPLWTPNAPEPDPSAVDIG